MLKEDKFSGMKQASQKYRICNLDPYVYQTN